MFKIASRFFGKSKNSTLVFASYISNWDFELIEGGEKYFDTLYKMAMEIFNTYPDDCESACSLVGVLFQCNHFTEKSKALIKEFIEITFKCLTQAIKSDKEDVSETLSGLSKFLMGYGDKNVIFKTILPLQNNFLSDDVYLKEASIILFTSLVSLEMKSVLTFITKTYPLFLKAILNPKETMGIRIACIVALVAINNAYPDILSANKDKIKDLLTQLLKDDASDNEFILLQMLSLMSDLKEDQDLISGKELKKILPILLEKYIKLNRKTKVDEVISLLFADLYLKIEDKKFYYQTLQFLSKTYEKGIPNNKHLLISCFLEDYFVESQDSDDFENFALLFKECYETDDVKVLIHLSRLTHLSKDKDKYFEALTKKILPKMEQDDIGAFEIFTSTMGYEVYLQNNSEFFVKFMIDLYERVQTGKIPYFTCLYQIYESFGVLCKFIEDKTTISYLVNLLLNTFKDLIRQVESDNDDDTYEQKYLGSLVLCSSIILFNYEEKGEIDYTSIVAPLLKVIHISQDFEFVKNADYVKDQLYAIGNIWSTFKPSVFKGIDKAYLSTMKKLIDKGLKSKDPEITELALLSKDFIVPK